MTAESTPFIPCPRCDVNTPLPRPPAIPASLFPSVGGSLRCGACKKERIDCLVWNPFDRIFEYRLRPPGPTEWISTAWHPEVGAVRVVVRITMILGTPRVILAEPILCTTGVALATQWKTAAIAEYGSVIPGRLKQSLRPSRSTTAGRAAPLPMRFDAASVYEWVFLVAEPIPQTDEMQLRCAALMVRLIGEGHDEYDLLVAFVGLLRKLFIEDVACAKKAAKKAANESNAVTATE